ncbi:MAG: MFS transporter [Armatimonadota bacterium]
MIIVRRLRAGTSCIRNNAAISAIVLFVCALLIELAIGGFEGWGALVPSMAKQYGYSVVSLQSLFGVMLVVFAVSAFASGRILDRIGEPTLLLTASLFYAIAYFLAGFYTGNYYMLLLSLGVIQSAAIGAMYLALMRLFVRTFRKRTGAALGVLLSAFAIGVSLMAMIAGRASAVGQSASLVLTRLAVYYGIPVFLFALAACPRNRSGARWQISSKIQV